MEPEDKDVDSTEAAVEPLRCSDCGTPIRWYTRSLDEPVLCNHCRYPRLGLGALGAMPNYGNYRNDPSGGSGSWDHIVRLYEDQERP